ncbi:hypothetical protein [Streptomyces niveus]|uniref:hypothetical protein n=1 Tax=Streptomyces niveus TaxID=193462 RepID=UPI0033D5000D
MAPQDSQSLDDARDKAQNELFATYARIEAAAQAGIRQPTAEQWSAITNPSSTTRQAGGQQRTANTALTFLPPTTPADYARSSATRPGGGQASGQSNAKKPGPGQ